MQWLEAALLGLLQGITEFLPVSSSGHLVLARALLGYDVGGGAVLEVLLHLGSALSIAVVFRSDLIKLLAAAPALFRPSGWRLRWPTDAAFRTIVLILVSALPAAFLGIVFGHAVESLFERPTIVAGLLIATGGVLVLTRFIPRGSEPLRFRAALTMGFAQALAILPGVSRSGSTIAAGLAAGANREEVGRFAFLMGLVPIVGAGLLKARELTEFPASSLFVFLFATAVAFGSGVFALRVLLRFVREGRLHLFAPYCLVVGVAGLFLT